MERLSGILIHPTSFPGKYGCGDLGEGAYKVIDTLKAAGQKILQILPLGPTGFGDSPYQAFSAFAGTPYIISFDKLIEDGYLTEDDLKDYPAFDKAKVDYGMIYVENFKVLHKAFDKFQAINKEKKRKPAAFTKFCKENAWLEDYATFMAIKDSKNGCSWDLWEEELRTRSNLNKLPAEVKSGIDFYKFVQWIFFKQWSEFKKYANKNGIKIIGDAPIFVSYDSSDVWANQHLFHLAPDGKPQIVAGVPPDYFSATGQLWGNPHYNWEEMAKDGYQWWVDRITNLLKLVDCVRVDHFRGFEAYWEVKYGEATAQNGHWVKAPGMQLFSRFKEIFGDSLAENIIAEDLGIITKEVTALRDTFNLPGMKIFEFAPFDMNGSYTNDDGQVVPNHTAPYLPENYPENCIAYPGTHDNDVILGWFNDADDKTKGDILNYLHTDYEHLNEAIITKLLESKARIVVFMMQDVLKLGTECRMNKPGTSGSHNWSWRLTYDLLDSNKDKFASLEQATKKSGR